MKPTRTYILLWLLVILVGIGYSIWICSGLIGSPIMTQLLNLFLSPRLDFIQWYLLLRIVGKIKESIEKNN